MKIAIWGYGTPVIEVLPVLKNANFDIQYVKMDYFRVDSSEFIEELERQDIKVYVDEYPLIPLDILFVMNYNRIISSEVIKQYLVVNYHLGLLPKWRGNSANGWGIINGEKYSGYSIHRVIDLLDGGPIYYQFKYPYKMDEIYFHAKKAMSADLIFNLPQVIKNIVLNPDNYLYFDETEFVYCSKFRQSDGFIFDWNICTEELIRLFYVFAPPLGTGLKFVFQDKTYEISSMSKIEKFAVSKGVTGGIVYKYNNSIWVKTKDTAVALDEIKCEGDIISPSTFKIGQRL